MGDTVKKNHFLKDLNIPPKHISLLCRDGTWVLYTFWRWVRNSDYIDYYEYKKDDDSIGQWFCVVPKDFWELVDKGEIHLS